MDKRPIQYSWILIFLILFSASLFGAEGQVLLEEGIEYFSTGLYKQAIINFRDILINPELEEYQGDAYFWISKSYMVLGKLTEAEKNLEYYLLNFAGHKDYSEAMYQKGRLLFMQNQYENAILVLREFIDKYPNSLFQSNAYFWIGESLFLMGKLDDALVIFKNIVQNFNTSFKYEAAKYRMSIIEFKKRENELLKLLKWSHMESLKSLEEFRKKERTYEQAIASYQKKLAILESSRNTGTGIPQATPPPSTGGTGETTSTAAEDSARIQSLNQEIARLNAQIDSYEAALAELQSSGGSQTGEDVTAELQAQRSAFETEKRLTLQLLSVKENALLLKSKLLNILEQKLGGQ